MLTSRNLLKESQAFGQNCNIDNNNVNTLAKALTFIKVNEFIQIELWKKQSVRAVLEGHSL